MRTRELVTTAMVGLLGLPAVSTAIESAPEELVTITLSGETLIEVLQRLRTDYGYEIGYPPGTYDRRGPHLYIESTPAVIAMQRLAEAYGLCARMIVGLESTPKFVMLKECEKGEFGRVQEPYQATEGEETQRVWLGVYVRDGHAQGKSGTGTRGALVAEIAGEGSVAEAAGIQVGDVISVYNGTAIETRQQLMELVTKTQPGDEVSIIVLRGGRPMTFIARF